MKFYLITLLFALATPLLAQDTCEGRAEGFYCTQDRSSFLWCFNQQSLPGETTVLRCPFGTYCDCPAGEVCGESGPCSGSGSAPSSSESGPLTQGGLPLETGMESSEETQGSESQGTVMESSESQPSESEPNTQGEQPLLSGTESQGSGIETILSQPSGTELGSTEQPNPTEPSSTEGGETTTLPAPLEYPQNFYYQATIEDSLNGVPQSSTIQNVYYNADEGQLRVDQNGIRQYTSETTEGAIQRTFDENSRACDTSSLDIFPVYRFDPRYQFQQNTFYQGQPALLYTYNTQTLDSSEQGTLYVAQGLETIPLFEQVTVTRSSPDMMGVTQTSTTYNSFVAAYPPDSTFILPPACLLGEESSE